MPIFNTPQPTRPEPRPRNFEAANEQQAYQQLAQYGLNASQVVPIDTPADQLSQAADAEAPTKERKDQSRKSKG